MSEQLDSLTLSPIMPRLTIVPFVFFAATAATAAAVLDEGRDGGGDGDGGGGKAKISPGVQGAGNLEQVPPEEGLSRGTPSPGSTSTTRRRRRGTGGLAKF